jgi:hypothetical protein
MDYTYCSYNISSTAERDSENNLFRAVVNITAQGKSRGVSRREPSKGYFQTAGDAEVYGLGWARGWIDRNQKHLRDE